MRPERGAGYFCFSTSRKSYYVSFHQPDPCESCTDTKSEKLPVKGDPHGLGSAINVNPTERILL
jgi:hypothetical protein